LPSSTDGIRFLHVPRTGGTTLTSAWRLGPPEYLGHELSRGERWTYGFCRNPWDRLVSVFHLLHPEEPREGQVTFNGWLLEGAGARMIAALWDGIPIAAPCSTWLRHANFVGRFEDRRDVELLAGALGRPVPVTHHGARESQRGHASTPRRHYSTYYTDKSRRIVAAVYGEDIERWGYTFEEAP